VSITKVVEFFTTNPTKLSLHFSEFSTIFYGIYKIQPKVKHYLRTNFHRGPWKFLQIHNHTLTLHKTPPEISQTLQCSPRAPAGGGPAKFRRTGGRDRPGAGGERPSGPWDSIPVLGLGRGTTGGRGRRSGAVTATRATAPARLHLRRGKRRFGRLGWRSTVVVMRSIWSGVA
jgi:hypothetical protein